MIARKTAYGDLLEEYIDRTKLALAKQVLSHGYKLSAEPSSALFSEGCTVEVLEIVDQQDPTKAKVKAVIRGKWNKHALELIQKLEALGIDYKAQGRSGGVMHNIPNKRISKFIRYKKEYKYDVPELWRRPEWKKEWLKDMFRYYKELSLRNIELAKADPQRIVGEKDPATGTGWEGRIGTRGGFAEDFKYNANSVALTITEYYDDLINMCDLIPEFEVLIEVPSTITESSEFKGTMGWRSDVDILVWDNSPDGTSDIIIEVGDREVSTDPSTVMHNHDLDSKDDREKGIRMSLTPAHMDPFDLESLIKVRTTPPATMGLAPDVKVLIAADLGYTDTPMFFQGTKLVIPTERFGSGADSSFPGGYIRAKDKIVKMIGSGSPFTTAIYYAIFGKPIGEFIGQNHLDVKIYQKGDDFFLYGVPAELDIILGKFGHYLRGKGMTVSQDGKHHTYFALGTVSEWLSVEDLVVYMIPRHLKSMARSGKKDELIEVKKPFKREPTAEAVAAAEEMWLKHPELIFFHGRPDEYARILRGITLAEIGKIGETIDSYVYMDASSQSVVNEAVKKAEDAKPEEKVIVTEPAATAEPAAPAGNAEIKAFEADVIIYGGPGVGKSTIGAMLRSKGYTVTESDEWRTKTEDGHHPLDMTKAPNTHVNVLLHSCPKLSLQHKEAWLLDAPDDVLAARLASRTTNDFGKTEDEQKKAKMCTNMLREFKFDKVFNASGTPDALASEVELELKRLLKTEEKKNGTEGSV